MEYPEIIIYVSMILGIIIMLKSKLKSSFLFIGACIFISMSMLIYLRLYSTLNPRLLNYIGTMVVSFTALTSIAYKYKQCTDIDDYKCLLKTIMFFIVMVFILSLLERQELHTLSIIFAILTVIYLCYKNYTD